MPDAAALGAGRAFERELAATLGGTLTPGSGNQPFRRMDVELGTRMLFTLKATKYAGGFTWAELGHVLDECASYVASPGGPGVEVLPVAAFRGGSLTTQPRDLVVMEPVTLRRVLEAPRELVLQSKADARNARAAMTELERMESET